MTNTTKHHRNYLIALPLCLSLGIARHCNGFFITPKQPTPTGFGLPSVTTQRQRLTKCFISPTKQDIETNTEPPDDDDDDKKKRKNIEDQILRQKELYEQTLTNDDPTHQTRDGYPSPIPPLLPTDDDFVLTSPSAIHSDRSLQIISSEIGIKQFVSDYAPSSDDALPLATIIERTMDTIEDVVVHLRRIPYEKGNKKLTPEEEATRKTVVILGSGWAAHALMKVADCQKLRLIVVSPSNHFLFTPMLPSAAVGTVEYGSMTEAVRAANPMIDQYLEGYATSVSLPSKTVTIQLNSLLSSTREGPPPTITIPYDHLVVSVGCRVNTRNIPGAEKHALQLKTVADARRLRTALGECFEYASRPDVRNDEEKMKERVTFLIVGGGPTGVEIAGEIYDLAEDITRKREGTYPLLHGLVRVVLVHSGPDLVPQFEENLREVALQSLRKKGVEVRLNTYVTEVGDGYATLKTKGSDEETRMTLGLTVWCAGTRPVPFVDELLSQLPPAARHPDGRISVDRWMRPPMPADCELGSVIVLGDAAAFPEGMAGEGQTTLPSTAQVAGQQGAYAARMFDRGYNLTLTPPLLLRPTKTTGGDVSVFQDPLIAEWLEMRGLVVAPKFSFLNLGLLAYLGGGEALSQVQVGDTNIFAYGGSIAFVLWRSVYLVKQVATRNRVLVTFDWVKSAIFGRDITRS